MTRASTRSSASGGALGRPRRPSVDDHRRDEDRAARRIRRRPLDRQARRAARQHLDLIGGAPEGEPQPMYYFDDRGVKRMYLTSVQDATWSIWRHPARTPTVPRGPASTSGSSVTSQPTATHRGPVGAFHRRAGQALGGRFPDQLLPQVTRNPPSRPSKGERDDHDDRTDDPHAGRARRHPDLRRPPDRSPPRPSLLLIGSPMGAGGFGTLAAHFTDRTVVTYDPRGVERSTQGRPGERVHARTSTPTTCTGSSPSSMPVRSTSSRAAAARSTRSPSSRRTPTRSAPSSRTSRRSPRSCPTARPRWRRAGPSTTTYQQRRLRRGHGAVHRRGRPPGPVRRRLRQPAGARSGDVRHADRGRRQPHRPAARPEHHLLHALRAGLRCASAASTRIVLAAGVESEGQLAARGAFAVAERLGTNPCASRATTAASSAASTARPASRRRSPRSCARCWPMAETVRARVTSAAPRGSNR